MAVEIKDFSTGLRVTNGSAQSVLYDNAGNSITYAQGDSPTTPRGVLSMSLNDNVLRPIRSDRFGSQALASNNVLLSADFEGGTLNASQFVAVNTTFAPAQTQGSYSFNPTNLTTANAVSVLTSLRRFKKMQRSPLHMKARFRGALVANSALDIGFATAVSGTTQIQTGCSLQISASNVLQSVITVAGTDVTLPLVKPTGGNLLYSELTSTAYYTYDIYMDDDEVKFFIQDTETSAILGEVSQRLPRTQLKLFLDSHLLFYARLFNAASVPTTAPIFILTDVNVISLDSQNTKPWGQTLASMGMSSANNPITGVQIAQFANSAAPTNAVLSNTAQSYTTLGGLFAFAAVAGAATDYNLFGFQVPSPYQAVITEIIIDTYNDGAAVATTASNLIWGIGLNGNSQNLSSGGHVRRTLGNQHFPVGAVVGAVGQRLVLSFSSTPLICDAGRFLSIILRLPIGTATGSQVIRGNVDINGYFE